MLPCKICYSLPCYRLYPYLVTILVYFLMPSVHSFSFTRKPDQPTIVVLNSNSTNVDLRWDFNLSSRDIFHHINLTRYEKDKGYWSRVTLGYYQVGYTNINTTLYSLSTNVTNGSSSGYVNFTIKDIMKQQDNQDGSEADPRSTVYIYQLEISTLITNIWVTVVNASDVEMKVLYVPEVTSMEVLPNKTWFCYGQRIVINCTAQSNSTTWYLLYQNEHLIQAARYGMFQLTLNNTGNIIYTCAANNTIGESVQNKSILLIVKEPPQVNNCSIISTTMINGVVIEGEWVYITCNISGSKPLNITWSNRKQVWNDRILMLNPVTRNDSGTYSVRASNGEECNNTAKTNFTIDVYYFSKILVPPTNQTVVETKNVSLTCYLEGKPVSTVTWLKDGNPINPAYDSKISVSPPTSVTNTSATITITNVNRTDEGSYSCQAANDVGNDTSSAALLIVNYPPKILVPPTSQTVVETSNVSLTCYLEGKPVSTVTWFKDGNPINPAYDSRISVSPPTSVTNTSATITITNVIRTDEGSYSCQAVNDVGNDTSSAALLTVNYVPEMTTINAFPERSVFCTGKLVHINCNSGAHPPASYSLYHNNELVCSGSTKGSFDVVLNTAGDKTFTCVPYNIVGIGQNKSLRLLVKEPPQIHNCSIISKTLTNGAVVEGNKAIVNCSISGSEPFSITWTNGKQVWNDRILIFQPVTRNDTGTYDIYVKANHGEDCNHTAKANVTFDVHYLDEPKVIGSNNKSYSPSHPKAWFNISVTAHPNEVMLSCETPTLGISTVISTYGQRSINKKTFIVFVIVRLLVESANITCYARLRHVQRQTILHVYKPTNSSFDCNSSQTTESNAKSKTKDALLGATLALSLLVNIIFVVGLVWFRRKESRSKPSERSEINKGVGHLNQISLQDERLDGTNQQIELSNVSPEYETVTPTKRRQHQPSRDHIQPNDWRRQIPQCNNPNNEQLPNTQPPIYQNIQPQAGIYSALTPFNKHTPKNTHVQDGEYQALQNKNAPQQYQSLDAYSKC